ncbi:hypothetical protein [Bhargavaea massiliensis]|uniref:hypothetical protein n=1 Tax=Bhargavaea massiliensis TaxID=2697500 RepID=UPI001BCFC517|nr:hypothetical protein [Bhargavaea massiliensis]
MEPIILLIISLIVGSLFKGKDNQKPPAQKPNQAPRPEVPKRSAQQSGNLKDLTKQLYEDLQREIQKESKEFRTDPRTSETAPQPKQERPRADRERTVSDRTAGRMGETVDVPPAPGRPDRKERVRKTAPVSGKTDFADSESLFPENEEELARAIVFAEILGPPKAKRR